MLSNTLHRLRWNVHRRRAVDDVRSEYDPPATPSIQSRQSNRLSSSAVGDLCTVLEHCSTHALHHLTLDRNLKCWSALPWFNNTGPRQVVRLRHAILRLQGLVELVYVQDDGALPLVASGPSLSSNGLGYWRHLSNLEHLLLYEPVIDTPFSNFFESSNIKLVGIRPHLPSSNNIPTPRRTMVLLIADRPSETTVARCLLQTSQPGSFKALRNRLYRNSRKSQAWLRRQDLGQVRQTVYGCDTDIADDPEVLPW